MVKKVQKYDLVFIASLIIVTGYFFLLIFQSPFLKDESFFPNVPLRLINGESLISDEWHLTQFSSLFLYIPVKLWLHINKSTDGIILFLRFIFLFLHAFFTIAVYKYFRKFEFWAVAAALIFYTYLPYSMFALSYASLLVFFLILFTFTLLSIYQTRSSSLFIFAGLSFGCCCVCNPILCSLFFLYLILILFWSKREKLLSNTLFNNQKKSHITKNKVSSYKNIITDTDSYNIFFTKKALFYTCLGISIIAIISIAFFFYTGGTLSSVSENIRNMLQTSEYRANPDVSSNKIHRFIFHFSSISLKLPFALPLFFMQIFFDKNRKKETHRYLYLIVSFLLTIFYMSGILIHSDLDSFVFSFPFSIMAITCYILTEKKNKPLFYCVWCPCILIAVIQLFFSNSILLAFGIIVTISNIAGVFFLMDLYKEMATIKKIQNGASAKKARLICCILLIGMFAQLLYQCCTDTVGKLPSADSTYISEGPYAGLHINADKKERYAKTLEDTIRIKNIGERNDPILIFSDSMWPYLCIDRPFGTSTAWLSWRIYPEDLKLYYNSTPEKIPSYIYISFEEDFEYDSFRNKLMEVFDFTEESLSNGLLLTVTDYKF